MSALRGRGLFMARQHDQSELIPYASHVAQGTGRTPIGIILFAASHLLLGAFIALQLARATRVWPALALGVVPAAVAMISGGTMLLMKGRGAWTASVGAFTMLALCEVFVTALGVARWYDSPSGFRYDVSFFFHYGGGLAVLSTVLLCLCIIVLRYLGSAKARDTFALPRGETPPAVRWLPRIVIAGHLVAIVTGRAIGLAFAP